jgi:prephenate dehydrogenase
VSILSFQEVLANMKKQGLLELLSGVLVVDVLSVKVMPKKALLAALPDEAGVLCTHPMFGPESGKHSWTGLPFLFEQVRVPLWGEAYRPGSVHVKVQKSCLAFLEFFKQKGCKMVEMGCEVHDQYAAGSQFVTHLTGRLLATQRLQTTPIDTKGFESLLGVVDTTCKDSFDLFYGLYRHNPASTDQLRSLERGLTEVKRLLELHDAKMMKPFDSSLSATLKSNASAPSETNAPSSAPTDASVDSSTKKIKRRKTK